MKKTQFIGVNVNNLRNHVVDRRFHNETKPQETFHYELLKCRNGKCVIDMNEMTAQPQVVIIGGGISGLAAASRLYRSGFENVKVLEASNVLGGRIRSKFHEGRFLEMGAQWIHGEIANVAFKLADQAGLVDNSKHEEDFDEKMSLENQGPIRDRFAEKLWAIKDDIEEESEGFEAKPGLSYGQYFDQKFEELTQDLTSEVSKYAKPFKDFCHRYTRSLDGATNWYDLSFDGTVHQYVDCEGNDMVRFKKGHKYQDLVQIFKDDIPYASISTNVSVTKIKYHHDEDKVEIITSHEGQTYSADYVIFTGSLGVLKKSSRQLFDPPLPEQKLKAIDQIGFGTVNKIFLQFESPIFDHDGINFLFDDNGISYDEQDAQSDWTRFILGAYVDDYKQSIVSLWLSGEGAKFMETLSEEQIQKDALKCLEKFLPKGQSLPNVKSMLVSKWSNEENILGSYSYQTVASETEGLGPKDLAEPVGSRVLFAGEATHEKYFSTVHGAIESGWREADRIICHLTEIN